MLTIHSKPYLINFLKIASS